MTKRVFLRADLNVPLLNNKIESDFRLQAIKPTLDKLIKENVAIILATHLGRPKDRDPQFSTKHLLPWFIKEGYTIQWTDSLEKRPIKPGTILLLENLRFWPGEKNRDKTFAKKLHDLADYYINDAFGLFYSKDTSVTLLPELYPEDHKSYGPLVEKELKHLAPLLDPERPFTMILGGAKIKDKLPFVELLLDKADTILILPALAFTFLKAQGENVGQSLVVDEFLDLVNEIIAKAQKSRAKLILPEDFLIARDTKDGELFLGEKIPDNGFGMALVPISLEKYTSYIRKSATIFLNGSMGFADRPLTMDPFNSLLHTIAQSSAYTVIGGGESVAAVYTCHLEGKMSFCSTGGGATLAYIAYSDLL